MATQLELQVLALTQALQNLINQSLTIHQLDENEQPSIDDEVGVWSSIQNKIMKLPISSIIAMVGRGSAIENQYDNITELLADQSNQNYELGQLVLDSSDDTTSGTAIALYVYLGVENGLLSDYIRLTDADFTPTGGYTGTAQDIVDLIPTNFSVDWNQITGNQKDVNLIGFTDGEIDLVYQTEYLNNSSSRSIVSNDNIIVSVGSSNGVTSCINYSEDGGISWVAVPGFLNGDNINDIIYEKGYFVCAGFQGASTSIIYKSIDGKNWVKQTYSNSQNRITKMLFAFDYFIALDTMSTNGKITYSSDGESWVDSVIPDSRSIYSFVYDGNKLILYSIDESLPNRYIETSDLVSFTEKNYTVFSRFQRLNYFKNKYVLSSNNGLTYYSDDFINFETLNINTFGTFNNVVNDVLFYIKADSIIYTKDLSVWNSKDYPASTNASGIIYNNYKFFTVGITTSTVYSFTLLERKFENIVNEYRVNGVKIEPVNKVLDIPAQWTEMTQAAYDAANPKPQGLIIIIG